MSDDHQRGAGARPASRRRRRWRGVPLGLRLLHWFIVVNLLANILYAAYQIFFALQPEGVSGPLWGAAGAISHELMVARRLYAIEVWICFAGLAIYLALVEILPRLLEGRRQTAGRAGDGE